MVARCGFCHFREGPSDVATIKESRLSDEQVEFCWPKELIDRLFKTVGVRNPSLLLRLLKQPSSVSLSISHFELLQVFVPEAECAEQYCESD